MKTAAVSNRSSDQKSTIDLSLKWTSLIPASLQESLASHGLDDALRFFKMLSTVYVSSILSSLSGLAGVDLAATHKEGNMNFHLCDYHPDTAAPESSNGCGAHTNYGTFSIIFQDSTPGLELEDADGKWNTARRCHSHPDWMVCSCCE